MEELDWMLDTDILDSFVEGEYYSTARWSMNSMTGYRYCGRDISKADSNFGEEQLLFLMNVYPPSNGYPDGRPSYFALSVSYLREHMMESGVTIDDLRQHTGIKQFHN